VSGGGALMAKRRRWRGAGTGKAAPGTGTPAAARGRRGGGRPEVGEDPDKRAPLAGERERGGREAAGCWRAGLG
jgi:hypothetical protein